MSEYMFRISYLVPVRGRDFDEIVLAVADHLHSNDTITDASIGVDLVEGVVEFEAGATAETVHEAFEIAARAVEDAIRSAGGRPQSFTMPRHEQVRMLRNRITHQVLTDWSERSTERVDVTVNG